jgi:hypothetical protein
MRDILIHSSDGDRDNIFDPNARDGCNEYLILLRERLNELGYSLRTADAHSLDETAWVLFCDSISVIPYHGLRGLARRIRSHIYKRPLVRPLFEECVAAGMGKRIILILNEPPSVSADNWLPELHERFDIILTWNDDYVDNKKFFKFQCPQPVKWVTLRERKYSQKKLLVNISMNKVSRHPRELYTERLKTIAYFDRHFPDDFSLYGVGWNRPKTALEKMVPFAAKRYKTYKGEIRSKAAILNEYRFCLCYENIRDEPGWITEKMFDCMRSGCVPIYWGANNILEYVDADAFIDRRLFRTNADLALYLRSVREDEFNAYLRAIALYLESDRFKSFLSPAYVETILRVTGIGQ